MSAPNAGSPAPLPEPKTPMWLPAVGAVLFLLGGLYWATSPEPVAITADADAGASDDAAVAVADAGMPIARVAVTASAAAPPPPASAAPTGSAVRRIGDAGAPRRPAK